MVEKEAEEDEASHTSRPTNLFLSRNICASLGTSLRLNEDSNRFKKFVLERERESQISARKMAPDQRKQAR
jgi:hypothetical protein